MQNSNDNSSISAYQLNVGDILGKGSFSFEVPTFQRPYSWSSYQAGDLLDDFLSFLEDDTTEVKDLAPYFLGSIVLIKGTADPHSQLVDGQQRLTTLTILLSVLRELCPDDIASDLTNHLYQPENRLLGLPAKYRLTIQEPANQFLIKYVQNEDGLQKLESKKNILNGTKLDSQRYIAENALYFLAELRKLPEAKIQRLAKYIVTQCYMVVVSTSDLSSAYRIFTVLNDRGLPLSVADLLKADVLGAIDGSEGRRDDYGQKWADEENKLGRERFQNLFSHIRMVRRKTKLRNMINEYRTYIRPHDEPEKFIDETLVPLSAAFDTVASKSYENYENVQKTEEVNETLQWLSKIEHADWIPPTILYLKNNENEAESILSFNKDLERLAAMLMMTRANVNRRIERYGRLISRIETQADLYSNDSPLQISEEEKSDVLDVLNGDIYNAHPQVRTYILLRLDSQLAEAGATYDHKRITVEHVLPQTPAKDSQWLKWFPDEQVRADYTHKLGNLVLLSRSQNAQAQNFDFDRKKNEYFLRGKQANFVLTNELRNHDDWTPEVIDENQRKRIATLSTLWRLTSPQ